MAEVQNTAGGVSAIIYQRMQGILLADGYETNLGQTVFQGRVKVADEQITEKGWAVSVVEGIDVVNQQSVAGRGALVSLEQRYGMVAYGVCDPNQPNVAAHMMLRDMKRAIWAGDANFGGQVRAVHYRSRDIGPKADGGNIVVTLLEIGVEYVEDLTKP